MLLSSFFQAQCTFPNRREDWVSTCLLLGLSFTWSSLISDYHLAISLMKSNWEMLRRQQDRECYEWYSHCLNEQSIPLLLWATAGLNGRWWFLAADSKNGICVDWKLFFSHKWKLSGRINRRTTSDGYCTATCNISKRKGITDTSAGLPVRSCSVWRREYSWREYEVMYLLYSENIWIMWYFYTR